MLSIRAKLVFFLVTGLVLAGVAASVATYYSTRMEFAALFDAQLKHSALELAESGRLDVNSVALVGQAPEQQITLQIYDASVNRLYIDRHSNVPLTIAETPGFSEFTDDTGHVLPPPSAPASYRRRNPWKSASASRLPRPCGFCSPC